MGVPLTRAVVITNPGAARVVSGAADTALAAARRRLEEGGLAVEVLRTTAPGDGERLARRALADGAEIVIAHGGDGTAMDVAAALVGSGVPLGLLPAGTGNILAGNLGVRRSPRAAAEVILGGRTRRIDVGRLRTAACQRYFAVACGAGFDAELMWQTDARRKRTYGFGAYMLTAVGLATAITRAAVRVEADGQVVESRAAMVLVANCGELIPGVLVLGSEIAPDDGMLNVIVIDAGSVPGAARVVWRLLLRRPGSDAVITAFRATHVSVAADPVLRVQADGEAAGSTPLDIDLIPRGLSLYVPHAR